MFVCVCWVGWGVHAHVCSCGDTILFSFVCPHSFLLFFPLPLLLSLWRELLFYSSCLLSFPCMLLQFSAVVKAAVVLHLLLLSFLMHVAVVLIRCEKSCCFTSLITCPFHCESSCCLTSLVIVLSNACFSSSHSLQKELLFYISYCMSFPLWKQLLFYSSCYLSFLCGSSCCLTSLVSYPF